MKKILLVIILLTIVLFANKVEGAGLRYYNLIDMSQVEYDNETDVFYSKQKIQLEKDKFYTLVVSPNFFGSITNEDENILEGKKIGTRFSTINGDLLNNDFYLKKTKLLYYSTIATEEECTLEFTDFLTKGYALDTLPKNEIILFEGYRETFKGFREVEYEEGFKRVENEIFIYTSYDNPIKTADISKKIKSYDNITGFNNPVILIQDNYKDAQSLGDYSLVYKTVDSSNLESTLTVNVSIVDSTPPEIIGDDEIIWDCYKNAPDPYYFRMNYTAFDNVDGNLTANLKVVNNALGMYEYGVPAEYKIVLEVIDQAGNVGQKIVTLKTSDITPPVLELEDLTINLSSLGNVIFGEFYDNVIAKISDNSKYYEKEITVNEIVGRLGFIGEYEVTVTARDKTGNKTVKTAKIRVIDDILPEFYIYEELLTTSTNEAYSLNEIKEVISENLYSSGILYDSITLISCDYLSNEEKPGEYSVKYVYTYKDSSNYVVGSIKVDEHQEQSYYWILFVLLIPMIIGGIFVNKKRKNL